MGECRCGGLRPFFSASTRFEPLRWPRAVHIVAGGKAVGERPRGLRTKARILLETVEDDALEFGGEGAAEAGRRGDSGGASEVALDTAIGRPPKTGVAVRRIVGDGAERVEVAPRVERRGAVPDRLGREVLRCAGERRLRA